VIADALADKYRGISRACTPHYPHLSHFPGAVRDLGTSKGPPRHADGVLATFARNLRGTDADGQYAVEIYRALQRLGTAPPAIEEEGKSMRRS
jgi:hypothetical protein